MSPGTGRAEAERHQGSRERSGGLSLRTLSDPEIAGNLSLHDGRQPRRLSLGHTFPVSGRVARVSPSRAQHRSIPGRKPGASILPFVLELMARHTLPCESWTDQSASLDQAAKFLGSPIRKPSPSPTSTLRKPRLWEIKRLAFTDNKSRHYILATGGGERRVGRVSPSR